MIRNFKNDEADQHALSCIESSEVFLSFGRILFSQKKFDFKTRGENAATLTTLIQNECLPYAPMNIICGLLTIK